MAAIGFPKDKTAILIMDCQLDIVAEDGKLAAFTQGKMARMVKDNHVLENIAALANAGRRTGTPLIYVRHAYRRGYADLPPNQPGLQFLKMAQALQEGSKGAEIHPAVTLPHEEDFVVTKTRPNAFFGSSLEALLRSREITHLVLTGVSTDGVVAHTATHGADLGFYIVVPDDCCTAMTPEQHVGTLARLQSIATLCKSSDVVAALNS